MDSMPDDIRDAVARAFPGDAVEDVERLGGGRSGAHVFAFRAGGRAFVARVSAGYTRAGRAQAPRELACMRAAAGAALAPAVIAVDEDAGVVVLERFEGAPFKRDDETIRRFGRALRALHAVTPPFPALPPLGDLVAMVDDVVRAAGGAGVAPSIAETMKLLSPRAAEGATLVSCHNDLNPTNILLGEDRVVFVDWESAGAADPWFDLAVAGVFACPGDAHRALLMEAYLGHAPSADERARGALFRVLALGYYAAALTLVAHRHGQRVDDAEAEELGVVLRAMGTTPPRVVAATLAREMLRLRSELPGEASPTS